MITARLFKLGNSQAIRIPARYRLDAAEVEVIKRGDELVLRAKARTAADVFARAREMGGDWSDFNLPEQPNIDPVQSFDD